MIKIDWDILHTNQIGRMIFISVLILMVACSPLSQLPPDSQDTIPPQPTTDPLINAAEQVNQILNSNPDFENNINSYAEIAAEINQHLVLVEHARPVLDLADQLKATDIILGNAWDILVETLDTAFTGSGQALIVVDAGLRQVMAFKGNLDALNTLMPVASASLAFREVNSPEHLRELNHSISTTKPLLFTIDQELSNQLQTLDEFVDSISIVQQGLSLAGSMTDVPIVGEAIITFNQSINEVAAPIVDIRDTGLDLHNRIQSDLTVMDSVQEIVYQAENPPLTEKVSQQTSPPIMESLDSVFGEWTVMLLIGFAAFLLLSGFLIWMSTRSKKNVVTAAASDSSSPPVSPYIEQGEAVPPPPVIAPVIVSASLHVDQGPMSGNSFSLSEDDMLIGRGSDCAVQIRDAAISRRHARLRYAEGAWFIQDQGSSSGSFVNNQQVQAGRLNSGDRITIGNTHMTFLTS